MVMVLEPVTVENFFLQPTALLKREGLLSEVRGIDSNQEQTRKGSQGHPWAFTHEACTTHRSLTSKPALPDALRSTRCSHGGSSTTQPNSKCCRSHAGNAANPQAICLCKSLLLVRNQHMMLYMHAGNLAVRHSQHISLLQPSTSCQ